jgi:D-xylose 1-dehydrogenase (NADP+, D-xylono-1,5-lactone-forming)
MSVTELNWGIVGCGSIATAAIAPAIRWSSNGRLLAIGSRDGAKATLKAAELGAERAYAPYDALLADPDVTAIYIGLPNGLHEEWAVRAAHAGKHVLCEKSLTLSAASARRISSTFAERRLRLVEGFMYRHHPQWNVVKRLLDDRAIGDVRLLRASLSGRCPPDDHRWSPELGGGVLYDVACYPLNVARFVLRAEPIRVSALGLLHTTGVDRAVAATMEFPDGVLATATSSFDAEHEEGLVIVGTRGRIEVERPFQPGWAPTSVVIVRGSERERIEVGGANHFLHQVEHFACLVLLPSKAMAPAEDGVRNAALLEAVAESRRTGRSVRLAEPACVEE